MAGLDSLFPAETLKMSCGPSLKASDVRNKSVSEPSASPPSETHRGSAGRASRVGSGWPGQWGVGGNGGNGVDGGGNPGLQARQPVQPHAHRHTHAHGYQKVTICNKLYKHPHSHRNALSIPY